MKRFDLLSGRLIGVKILRDDDQLKNFGFYNCLSFFETYVYGVVSQYGRITENIMMGLSGETYRYYDTRQLSLDTYYYTLVWDKLKKVFEQINYHISQIQKDNDDLKSDFKTEYRIWKRRFEHLLREYDKDVRNKYEHPSFEPLICGNIIEQGTWKIDDRGNIVHHVEGNTYSVVCKDHVELVDELRIELIDLIIKYFSDKILSRVLLKKRDEIEGNIENYVEEYQRYREMGGNEESMKLFTGLIQIDILLSKEGIHLSEDVKNKITMMIL